MPRPILTFGIQSSQAYPTLEVNKMTPYAVVFWEAKKHNHLTQNNSSSVLHYMVWNLYHPKGG